MASTLLAIFKRPEGGDDELEEFMSQASIRQAALPPMLDAVAATIVADSIDAKESTILLDPMLQVGSWPRASAGAECRPGPTWTTRRCASRSSLRRSDPKMKKPARGGLSHKQRDLTDHLQVMS